MKRIICYLFGHKYTLHRKITKSVREVKCARCKKMFGMCDDSRSLLPMDFELYELHKMLLNP